MMDDTFCLSQVNSLLWFFVNITPDFQPAAHFAATSECSV